MSLLENLLRKTGVANSLRSRIRAAQSVLLVLMLIPAVVAISLMMVFSTQYHRVILHMEQVSSLKPLIQEELLVSMREIVVGRAQFEQGVQYAYLDAAESLLDALLDALNEGEPGSRVELTVARRTLGTLRRYIDMLGAQMRDGSTVDEDVAQLEEIQNVAALFLEMLQDALYADIKAAGQANHRMQSLIVTTLGVEIALLFLSLVFAILSQRSLSRSIRDPIDHLKRFAGRIAAGELQERAEPPRAEELQELTQSLNTMAEKLERLIAENTREQQNLKKSELRALQAQITPHFLYNTLDAIIWLAESKRTAEVVQITSALSDFFRTSLSRGEDWITIRQEQDHLLGYLTILHVRYRDILKYEIDIDERLYDCHILKLLIQPLVENAVYHGIKNKRGGGLVQVSIQKQGEHMRVEVRDNGAGMNEEKLAQLRRTLETSGQSAGEAGYGLSSVEKRIKLYCNQNDGLYIESIAGEGTTVRFFMPIRRINGA